MNIFFITAHSWDIRRWTPTQLRQQCAPEILTERKSVIWTSGNRCTSRTALETRQEYPGAAEMCRGETAGTLGSRATSYIPNLRFRVLGNTARRPQSPLPYPFPHLIRGASALLPPLTRFQVKILCLRRQTHTKTTFKRKFDFWSSRERWKSLHGLRNLSGISGSCG